jgi:hypothetical protein
MAMPLGYRFLRSRVVPATGSPQGCRIPTPALLRFAGTPRLVPAQAEKSFAFRKVCGSKTAKRTFKPGQEKAAEAALLMGSLRWQIEGDPPHLACLEWI